MNANLKMLDKIHGAGRSLLARTARKATASLQAVLYQMVRARSEKIFGGAAIEGASDSASRFLEGTYTNDAGTRNFKLYIPSAYRGQALPLVVMLHGCKQDPDDFAEGTQMNALAEEQQCLVAYPAQASCANGYKCWNWFKSVDQQRDQGEPSLIAGITRQIIDNYNVDTRRVFVAGLSAGGSMAVIMGATYPDLYAAIGVHSGLAYGGAHDLYSAIVAMRTGSRAVRQRRDHQATIGDGSRPVSTIVFHGDQDTTVHPGNGDLVMAQNTLNGGRGVSPVENKLVVEEGQIPDGHAYTRTIHKDKRGRGVAEQWLVHGAGHAWSGGSDSGSFTDQKGPNATREMLRFFFTQARPAH